MPEYTPEQQKRVDEFIAAYGKLTEEFKVDFISYPLYQPDGAGGWKLTIQTQPTDTTNQPVKSPFIAKE